LCPSKTTTHQAKHRFENAVQSREVLLEVAADAEGSCGRREQGVSGGRVYGDGCRPDGILVANAEELVGHGGDEFFVGFLFHGEE
jgi:hypothetical protein